jgi:Domain of unknown function (DUF4602)
LGDNEKQQKHIKMSKTKTGDALKANKKENNHKHAREPVVVACPSAFPISKRTKLSAPIQQQQQQQQKSDTFPQNERNRKQSGQKKLLDWSQTAREIHSLGASGFVGKQKREHQDEQYTLLTGRQKKKQHVPLPIVRKIRKAAQVREARQLEASKAAGILLPQKRKSDKKKKDDNYHVHGPSPSVGFMKNGILRVNPNAK